MKKQKFLLLNLVAIAVAVVPAVAKAESTGDLPDKTATFEENTLPAESHWIGDGTPDDMYAGELNYWYSGQYMFTVNKHSDSWWSGYALSNETSKTYATLDDQFHSAAGGAHQGDNFLVYYDDTYNGELRIYDIYNEEGAVVDGMYVTNSAYAMNSIINGDAIGSTPFDKGDYFKMIITGYDINEQSTGKVEYYLADYRSENSAEHYCIDTWQWVDLSSLGKVSSVSIHFETSQTNAWGALTPLYACIDNFNSGKTVGVESATADVTTQISAMANALRIVTDMTDYRVDVFTAGGAQVYSQGGFSGNSVVELETPASGMYVVRVSGAEGTVAKRIVLK